MHIFTYITNCIHLQYVHLYVELFPEYKKSFEFLRQSVITIIYQFPLPPLNKFYFCCLYLISDCTIQSLFWIRPDSTVVEILWYKTLEGRIELLQWSGTTINKMEIFFFFFKKNTPWDFVPLSVILIKMSPIPH